MRRRAPIVLAFAGLALLWGLESAALVDAAGWNPLLAPASAVLLLAAFGWARRGREFVDVFGPATGVAYAAYVGLAVVRLTPADVGRWQWLMPPLVVDWPVVLAAGIPFALLLATFAAVPAALVPLRRRPGRAADERFWAFVAEQNARDRMVR